MKLFRFVAVVRSGFAIAHWALNASSTRTLYWKSKFSTRSLVAVATCWLNNCFRVEVHFELRQIRNFSRAYLCAEFHVTMRKVTLTFFYQRGDYATPQLLACVRISIVESGASFRIITADALILQVSQA